MHTHTQYTQTYIHIHGHTQHIPLCMHTHVQHTCTRIHVVHTHTHVCVWLYTHTSMYTHIYIYTHLYICKYCILHSSLFLLLFKFLTNIVRTYCVCLRLSRVDYHYSLAKIKPVSILFLLPSLLFLYPDLAEITKF